MSKKDKENRVTFGLLLPADRLKNLKILSLELNIATHKLMDSIISEWWETNKEKAKTQEGVNELLAWLKKTSATALEELKEDSNEHRD
jgi:hypothetical protein